jgi:hypothetical protein
LAGSDTINLDALGVPTGLTGSVHGQRADPTGSDKLIVNGLFGGATVNFAPTTSSTGSVTVTGIITLPVTNYTGSNRCCTSAAAVAICLLSRPRWAARDHLYPGATQDSGTVTQEGFVAAQSLTPLEFKDLGIMGVLRFAGRGGRQSGSTSTAPTATIGSRECAWHRRCFKPPLQAKSLPAIETPGVLVLRLIGEEGDDTFNVPGNHPFPLGISVQGGDPSASDVLNFTSSGGNVTVNFAASTVTEAGFSPVSFTGVEILNLNAAGGGLTVTGTDAPETWRYTPTLAAAGTVTRDGAVLVTHFTNVAGTFALNAGGGSDSLVVNGTATPDLITVTGTQVTVGALKTVDYAAVEALTVNGNQGSDTFNVTPSATVPYFLDGGDPIGVLPGDHINIAGPAVLNAGPENDEGSLSTAGNLPVSRPHRVDHHRRRRPGRHQRHQRRRRHHHHRPRRQYARRLPMASATSPSRSTAAGGPVHRPNQLSSMPWR